MEIIKIKIIDETGQAHEVYLNDITISCRSCTGGALFARSEDEHGNYYGIKTGTCPVCKGSGFIVPVTYTNVDAIYKNFYQDKIK